MKTLQKINKNVFAIFLIAFLILSLVPALAMASSPYQPEELIKGSADTVYYIGQDSKRYVFPGQKIYMSWYENFDDVRTIDDADLNTFPIAGVVRYKPGVKMIKVPDDPKVYTVSAQGLVRHVMDENIAQALYGAAWNSYIDDMQASLFISNYSFGAAITTSSDYDPAAQTAAATSISADFGLIDTSTESSESSGDTTSGDGQTSGDTSSDDTTSGDSTAEEQSGSGSGDASEDSSGGEGEEVVPTLHKDIEAIAFAPSDSQKVYAVSSDPNVGIAISSNGGTSWTTGRDGAPVTAVAVSHADADTALAIEDGVILRTTDGGTSWDAATVPSSFDGALGLDFSKNDPAIAYAVSETMFIKSSDGGSTWVKQSVVNQDTYTYTGALEVSHTNGSLVLVGSTKGVQRTVNDGANWTQHKPGTGEMMPVRSIALNQDNTSVFYMVTDEGVWYTADTGDSWNVTKAPGVDHKDVHNIALAPSDTNILYLTTESGVFSSPDRAVTWDARLDGMALSDAHAISVAADDALKVLVGTDDQAEDNAFEGMYSTMNGGNEWAIVGSLIL